MKKILLILSMFTVQCYAQEKAQSLEQLSDAVIHMRDNLDKSHHQFREGLYFTIGGLIVTGGGIMLQYPKKMDSGNFVLISLGGVLTTLGTVFMIDSHKFIGRAGRWNFNGNSITINF